MPVRVWAVVASNGATLVYASKEQAEHLAGCFTDCRVVECVEVSLGATEAPGTDELRYAAGRVVRLLGMIVDQHVIPELQFRERYNIDKEGEAIAYEESHEIAQRAIADLTSALAAPAAPGATPPEEPSTVTADVWDFHGEEGKPTCPAEIMQMFRDSGVRYDADLAEEIWGAIRRCRRELTGAPGATDARLRALLERCAKAFAELAPLAKGHSADDATCTALPCVMFREVNAELDRMTHLSAPEASAGTTAYDEMMRRSHKHIPPSMAQQASDAALSALENMERRPEADATPAPDLTMLLRDARNLLHVKLVEGRCGISWGKEAERVKQAIDAHIGSGR